MVQIRLSGRVSNPMILMFVLNPLLSMVLKFRQTQDQTNLMFAMEQLFMPLILLQEMEYGHVILLELLLVISQVRHPLCQILLLAKMNLYGLFQIQAVLVREPLLLQIIFLLLLMLEAIILHVQVMKFN